MATKEEKITGAERKQRRLFKLRRGGVVLSEDEVIAIKAGRKKLRKEMRAMGIKSKKEFELTASGMGLYFDKRRGGLLLWFFHGRGLLALLGALALLMLAVWAFSAMTDLKGHFTINMGDDLFREGFTLSETVGFENPSMRLFAEPAVDVPCISITDIDEKVSQQDGQNNTGSYFAYTFYLRNEGESTVDYTWEMRLNSESKNLSDAAWVMLFEDGEMTFFAEQRADGTQEALPYFDDNTRGYTHRPMYEYAADPGQYEEISSSGSRTFYRLVPYPFESEEVVTSGLETDIAPMDVRKYTVVIWLEGDDPDCTDEKIGGHVGMEMNFQLVEEDEIA